MISNNFIDELFQILNGLFKTLPKLLVWTLIVVIFDAREFSFHPEIEMDDPFSLSESELITYLTELGVDVSDEIYIILEKRWLLIKFNIMNYYHFL